MKWQLQSPVLLYLIIIIFWAVRPWSQLSMFTSRRFVCTNDGQLQWCRKTDHSTVNEYKQWHRNMDYKYIRTVAWDKDVLSCWGTYIYTLLLKCCLVIFGQSHLSSFLIGSLISPCFSACIQYLLSTKDSFLIPRLLCTSR